MLPNFANLDNKALFYASKLYCEFAPVSDNGEYRTMPQAIMIVLLDRPSKSDQELEATMGSFPSIEEFAQKYGIALDDPDMKTRYDLYVES